MLRFVISYSNGEYQHVEADECIISKRRVDFTRRPSSKERTLDSIPVLFIGTEQVNKINYITWLEAVDEKV